VSNQTNQLFSGVHLSLSTFRQLAKWSARSIVLLVLSGGLVRLTDSGLGCPSWPNCEPNHFTAPLSFHPEVEDINRFINAGAFLYIVIVFVAAFKLVPRRKDLIFWSSLLILGFVIQIPLGAVVVYSHLYPPFVIIHFLFTMSMICVAVVLHHRAVPEPINKSGPISDRVRRVVNLFFFLTGIVIVTGSMTSGAGPHGGSRHAKRLPLSLVSAVYIHSTAVAAILVLSIAVIILMRLDALFDEAKRWAFYSLASILGQGAVGVIQYELKLPIFLVALHLFGACVVLSVVTKLWLVCSSGRIKLAD
jgi:cytochrome c oxidase assembly protein subunit 15